MRGLWLENNHITLRQDLSSPSAGDEALLLKVRLAGICGTDMELLRGYAGFKGVPGHEFVAEVMAGPDDWRGRLVVADINIACGHCEFCRKNTPHHCQQRSVIGIRGHQGAFAEYLTVPLTNACLVPEALDPVIAALAEPTAAALEVQAQLQLDGSERVLIIGAGRLGQLTGRVLGETARVDMLIRDQRRRPALATAPVNCVTEPDQGYDVVVECSGQPDGFQLALDVVNPTGRILLKSTYHGLLALDASRIVVNEITLLGSRCGPIDKAIVWLQQHQSDLSVLSFQCFPLENYKDAFETARDPAVYKVLFAP